jgi:hypothetical protein
MLNLVRAVVAVAVLVGTPTASLAQAPASQPAATQSTASLDPNEVVCRKQEITGSRLGSKRICKTRREWADAQLQDRQDIEKLQTQRHMKGQ